MEMIAKFFRGEVKDVNEDKKTLTAVISTKDSDRDGDIVLPSSFKTSLKGYMKHPVLLADHNYYDLRKQIGKAKKITINDNDVVAEFEYFHGEGNDEADWAWKLAKEGLASFSIGFIGLEAEPMYSKDENGEKYYSGRKFTKIELMEVSQVLIPSNRGALQASADLHEMACKSIKEGKLKMPDADAPKEEDPDAIPPVVEDPPAEKPEDKPAESPVVPEDESGEPKVDEKVEAPVVAEEKPADGVCEQCGFDYMRRKDGSKFCGCREEIHYSEIILGKGGDEPVPEPNKESINEAIKQGVAEALKREE